MKTFFLRLLNNEDPYEYMEYIRNKETGTGYVLSAVGDLSEVAIKCPGMSLPEIKKGHFEVISINGIIESDKMHLHSSFSDSGCNVIGGHLSRGSKVLKSLDILLGFFSDSNDNHNVLSLDELKKSNRLKLYILNGCPWSKRARLFLKTNKIKYIVKVINNDQEFKTLNELSNTSTFPQVFLDGKFIGGYDELISLKNSQIFKELIN
tara:strand:+ start:212 stop:832 length:621 start_codon:yes stop_codon:yes gene_type:complete